jgi:spore germination protein KC
MRNIALILFIAIVLAVNITGCYDRREADEMAYVMAIGFDKGVTDKLRLTLQVVTFKGGKSLGSSGGTPSGPGDNGDQGKGEADGTVVFTIDCPSFFTGLNMANIVTARQLNLMHAKLLVFSEEMARSNEIEKYLAAMVRYREIRRIMHFVITKGKAEDILKENKPLVGKNPSKTMQLLGHQSFTGFFPRVRLFAFYNNLKSNMEQPIAILANVNALKNLEEPGQGAPPKSANGGEYLPGELPRKGGVKREFFGAAVFRGARMVGELNGSEARILGMVTGEFQRGFFTIQDPLAPDYVVPLDIHLARKPKIKVTIQGDSPEIYVRLRLEGDMLAVQSRINYESPQLKPTLEQAFEQEIKNQLDSLIAKCQHEFQADIFGFGRSAVYHFPTIETWEKYNWLNKFSQAKVHTEIDFIIRRTGMMLKSSPIVPIEEVSS